jgi:glycosyltransferase involved in cell wall biosynthesis
VKVSIITSCFNSEKTIEDTIQSVLSQTYSNIEYIIIDGKSTDKTLEIINSHRDKITKVVSEEDNGIYDALNKGINLATGDIIGFLHSDDIFAHSNVIENVVKLFKETNTDAVYADLFYVNRKNTNKIIRNWKSGNYKSGMFLNGWMPPHPTVYIKKEVYENLGFFNLDFKTAADYELMLRFFHKHKINLTYLKEVTVKMRVGGESNVTLKNRINANKEDRKAWKINNLKPRFYTLWLKPLRKIFQYL